MRRRASIDETYVVVDGHVVPSDPNNHDGLTAHALRHAAASLAIAAGADVKVVQQMLGHRSATMTLDPYGHLSPTVSTRSLTRWTRLARSR